MRALRWLLLVPACAVALCAVVMATIATHYLVEPHLCPAADFDRGTCSYRGLGVVLEAIKHGGASLAVIVPAGLAVVIAPSRKRQVLWAALAVLLLVAAYFGYAGNAGSLFVAALVGALAGATAMLRFIRGQGSRG
jgi:hypothetical protein